MYNITEYWIFLMSLPYPQVTGGEHLTVSDNT